MLDRQSRPPAHASLRSHIFLSEEIVTNLTVSLDDGIQQKARSLRVALCLAAIFYCAGAGAAQVLLSGPTGTETFGRTVIALPNGNFVVTDPLFDAPGPIADVGAAFLYRPGGELISTLTGSTANDQVGSGGVTLLGNGNYVVRSSNWDNGAAVNAGAATWGSGTSGISGVVSITNSLVGTSPAPGRHKRSLTIRRAISLSSGSRPATASCCTGPALPPRSASQATRPIRPFSGSR